MSLVNTFLIGGDPEFLPIVDKETALNCYGIGLRHTGKIGRDCNAVELRPSPALSAFELVKNIRRLLMSTKLSTIRKFFWRSGAVFNTKRLFDPRSDKYIEDGDTVLYGSRCRNINWQPETYSLGGHVHIDLPCYEYEYLQGSTDEKTLYKKRINALDLVTKALEASNIHPKKECDERRSQRCGYGKFGEVRSQSKTNAYTQPQTGDAYRFEYRTPCCFLTSPDVAMLSYTMYKLSVIDPAITLNLFTGSSSGIVAIRKLITAYREVDADAEHCNGLVAVRAIPKLKINPANVSMQETWGIPSV